MPEFLTLAQVEIGGAPATNTNTTVAPAAKPAETGKPVITQDGSSAASQSQPAAPKTEFPWGLVFMIGLVVIVYIFMFRGKNKEEKQRKKMIDEMKRGDEVMTIGGLIGKVVDVRDDRVVIKVDEANNVKETYLKSAIQKVLTADTESK